ncbi:MAG: S41 family peptidase [Bacteroidota bacterium]
MKNQLAYLFLFISLGFWGIPGQAQDKFSKVYARAAYLADLDSLVKTMIEVHPSPYEFTSKEAFWEVIDQKKKAIRENTTFAEFLWMCSEVIAQLKCAHSGLGWFNQEDEVLPIALRFPVEGRFINEKLYVTEPWENKAQIRPGEEILSINGVKVSEIKAKIYRHINSQGNNTTYKKSLTNTYFTAYMAYALGFPKSYRLLLKGRDQAIRLQSMNSFQPQPIVHPDDPCQDRLCLRVDEGKNTAILSIRTFSYYGDQFPTFKSFVDQSFKEINKQKVKHLILDLRLNDGGPSDAGIYLMRYLSPEPFRYFAESAFDEKKELISPFPLRFKGNTYFLMDGFAVSTAAHFLSIAKHLKLGKLIGEEVNGNQLCFGGQKKFFLPHTGIHYYVSRYRYLADAPETPLDQSLPPDLRVTQGIEDYLNGKDTVMEYAQKLINEN